MSKIHEIELKMTTVKVGDYTIHDMIRIFIDRRKSRPVNEI